MRIACSSWSRRSGPAKTCCPAAVKCVPARSWSRAGSILEPARLGVLASVGRTDGQGRAAAAGRDRAHRRRAGRAGPGAGTRPDPQFERRDARRPGDQAGALATVLPIAPDDPGAAGRDPRARARSADVLVITGGVSAGQRDLVPAALGCAGGRGASFTRCVSSRANRSGSESDRRGAIAPRRSCLGCPAIP